MPLEAAVRSTPASVELATLLFVSPAGRSDFAAGPDHTLTLIDQAMAALGPDCARVAGLEVAFEYGAHPETATVRMRRCLKAVEQLRSAHIVPAQQTGEGR